MLRIRILTEATLEQADDVFRAAFHVTESRISTLRQNLLLQPDGWFLALWDERPVGLIGAINYGPFAYVGSFSVIPAMQRHGIGQELLAHLLSWLERQDCQTVVLDATPDGLALYTRFSFVEDDTAIHWVHQSHGQANTLASTASSEGGIHRYVEVLRPEHIAALTAFDAPYFGAGRAALFSLLQMRYPERAFLLRNEEGSLCGYLFAQQRTLGPWVAESTTDAQILLDRALTLPFAAPPVVFVPGSNLQSPTLLKRAGFTQLRTLRHMRRGKPLQLGQRAHLYGLASFTLG